jgi:hypothetical protein
MKLTIVTIQFILYSILMLIVGTGARLFGIACLIASDPLMVLALFALAWRAV